MSKEKTEKIPKGFVKETTAYEKRHQKHFDLYHNPVTGEWLKVEANS